MVRNGGFDINVKIFWGSSHLNEISENINQELRQKKLLQF